MTLEELENYTCGYLGRAVLLGGSYYASGMPRNEEQLNNVFEDGRY